MENWNQDVENALKILLDSSTKGPIAVFDADGTLWADDLGEAFFKHQIQFQLAPAINKLKNPWEDYISLDKISVADSNAWIAKLNAGLSLSTVREQAKNFYNSGFKQGLNPLMKNLIRQFQEKGFEIWIVSASFRWAIEPALYDLDIPLDNLVGTETEITADGILTQIVKMPIPYGEGKLLALTKNLKHKPQFVVGNTLGDLHMLKAATDLPLVVQYLPSKPEIEGSALALRREAESHGWLIQTFRQ